MKPRRPYLNVTVILLAVAGLLAVEVGSAAASALFIVALCNVLAHWLLDKEAGRAAGYAQKLLAGRPLHHRQPYTLPVQKRLHTVGLQTVLSVMILWIILAVIAWLAGMSFDQTLLVGTAIIAALAPAGLAAVALAMVRHNPKNLAAAASQAIAAARADSAALALVVLVSLVALAGWHIPLALPIVQLLAVSVLLLSFPIAALGWDERFPKLHDSLAQHITFGAVAAALAYVNFLFFFARSGLGPDYVSTNNPYYFKATSLALLTLVLCQAVSLLLARANDHQSIFTSHLRSNTKLLVAFGISLFILANIIYNPWLQNYFSSGPLSLLDWLWAIVAAGIYLGVRLLQRHTRKHTRHAILELHRINSK